jgi:hypothetical protein
MYPPFVLLYVQMTEKLIYLAHKLRMYTIRIFLALNSRNYNWIK